MLYFMCMQAVNGNEPWSATAWSNNNPVNNWNQAEQEPVGNNGKWRSFTVQPP